MILKPKNFQARSKLGRDLGKFSELGARKEK